MARILLVKTSSLGDVVHNLPVVADIAAALPGARVDWVVEESFAPIPGLNRGVARVIPVAIRRWRVRLLSPRTWREAAVFRNELRATAYDYAVDTQGLFKSAIITSLAHGRRFGLGWQASREPLFPFYHRTFDVARTLHAVERNRRLAAQALGYTPADRVDYAISSTPGAWPWLAGGAYAVLIHATSARAKLWPEPRWAALGRRLAQDGLRCVLPSGSAEERARSERLAASLPDAIAAPPLALDEIASLLAGARCVVGVDTGLTHLAGALGVATIGIYTRTDPAATGLYGCARAVNVGGRGKSPQVDEVIAGLRKIPG